MHTSKKIGVLAKMINSVSFLEAKLLAGNRSDSSLLISYGKTSSLSTEKWGVLGSKAALE